ncbi:hypothetical protein [Phormidium nigroviride]
MRKDVADIQNNALLFVIDEVELREFETRELQRGKNPRCFFFEKNESILAHLSRRHHRPSQDYRKLLPQVYEKAGFPADTKARWSQYAGCSCPCSPGFILYHPEGLKLHHVFVSVVMDETEALKLMAQGNMKAFA